MKHQHPEPPKRQVHVAVDIETTGTTADSAIVSVGLAAFTLQGGIVATYYDVLNLLLQQGRKTDTSTMEWWDKQPEGVQQALVRARTNGTPPHVVVSAIQSFVARFNEGAYELGGVWGFGADFDNATLQSLAATYDVKLWDYRKNRCGRTLVAITGTPRPTSSGTHHHALDDARFQAEWFRSALRQLGNYK